jgi:uncharacterized protein involved in exopolysaccharide biosynthesis
MLEGPLPTQPLEPKRPRRDQSIPPTRHQPEYISFAEIVAFIRHYRWTIAIPVLCAIALAGLYILNAAPTFTARSQVLIDPKTPILREQTGEVNFSLDAAQVESHIAILRSEKIALAVITKLGLQDDPEFKRGYNSFLYLFSSRNDEDSSYSKERYAIAAFAKWLSVHRVGLSYAIEISFSSTNPERAAQIVNAVTDAYVRDQLDSKSEAARQGSKWLEERIAGFRSQMNMATKKVQAFKAKHDYRIPDIARDRRDGTTTAGVEETLEELEATAETYRKIFESFLQAYTTSVLRQSYPVSDARVITAATPPLGKSHPRATLIFALSLLIGLMAGLGSAFARHNFAGGTNSRAQPKN